MIQKKTLLLRCCGAKGKLELSETRTRENVKYIDNGNIGLGMLNWSKLHLNRFDTIQVVKNYCEILKA